MAESLESLWNKMSLTEAEQEGVIVDHEWVQETEAEGENCIIGRLLSSRGVNLDAMRNVFHKIWKLKGDLIIKEVDEKVYVFRFGSWVEKERVLIQQPWSFNKALLVMKEFDGKNTADSIELS